jgi:GNAT superfamily N-acetyltransferase
MLALRKPLASPGIFLKFNRCCGYMSNRPIIEAVSAAQISDVANFVLQARAELFPKLNAVGMPYDLKHFDDTYLRGEGQFLVASVAGKIVASIGYLPYDWRFPQIDYQQLKVVEVVRLFVLPAFRRSGLAGELYRVLKAMALQAGVEVVYLHTHPFLPGAIDFWTRQGFEVIDIEADPVWQTTHMESRLPG